MKVLIVCLMLVFMGLHLAKRKNGNNYFALLCGFVITAMFWAFAQSWAWQVASLYVTAGMMVWVRIYKPMRPFKDLDSSIFVQLYEKHLSRVYNPYDVYIDYGGKIKKFSDIIRKLRIIMIFLIFCVLVICCCQLIIGQQVWWKWIIPAPVGLICLGGIIKMTRDFLHTL